MSRTITVAAALTLAVLVACQRMKPVTGALHARPLDTAQAYAALPPVRLPEPAENFALGLQAMRSLQEDKAQDALALLEPVLAAGNHDIGLMALAGEAAMRSGKHELAAQWFSQASSLAPEVAGRRGATSGQGDDVRALDVLELAVQQEGATGRIAALLVMRHLRSHNFAQALAEVRDMAAQGDNPALRNFEGAVLLVSGDLPGARRAFQRALALAPADLAALDKLAELDLADQKAPQARRRYRAVLARQGNSVPHMVALARLETRLGNLPAAVRWLERAIAVAPGAAQQTLTSLHLRSGQADKAWQQAQRLHAADPATPASLDLLCQAAAAAGNQTQALECLQQLAVKRPGSAELQLRLARSHLLQHQTEPALRAVRRALAIEPGREDALILASTLLIDRHAYEDARKLGRTAQRRQPDAAIGFKLEADALLEQGRPDDAVPLYERGFKLQRSSAMLIALHRALHAAGKSASAEQRMRDWLAQHEADQATRLYYASHLLQRGELAAARREYETILRRDPDHVIALNDLAWALLRLNDSDALRPAERAYRLAPDNPAVADTLAWILAERGQPARALPLLKKALASAPGAGEIRLHYAHALFRSGDKRAARGQCERLLAVQDFPRRSEVEGLLAGL
jgi:putative PEP-CTERM system TPR-repeat lipoprotein